MPCPAVQGFILFLLMLLCLFGWICQLSIHFELVYHRKSIRTTTMIKVMRIWSQIRPDANKNTVNNITELEVLGQELNSLWRTAVGLLIACMSQIRINFIGQVYVHIKEILLSMYIHRKSGNISFSAQTFLYSVSRDINGYMCSIWNSTVVQWVRRPSAGKLRPPPPPLLLSGVHFAVLSLSKTMNPYQPHGCSNAGDPALSPGKSKGFFHLGAFLQRN